MKELIKLKNAYASLYALVGADRSDHVVFTSSGAEGVNHAIFSTYLDITRPTGKNHFIAGMLDEAPAIQSLLRLQEMGCLFDLAPVNAQGIITVEAIAESMTPRTALVSLSAANGLTGVIQPIQAIAELCRERGVWLHIEASHILGKGYFSFADSGADILTFDGELIGGPAGTGALFHRSHLELSPFIRGVTSVNKELLVKLGERCRVLHQTGEQACLEWSRARETLEQAISSVGKALFTESERLPHRSCLLFPGVHGEALSFLLKKQGVVTSCGGGHFQHLKHQLKSCQIPEPDCYSGLSFNMQENVETELLLNWVKQLQSYSRGL